MKTWSIRNLVSAFFCLIALLGCESSSWKTKDISGLMPVLEFNLIDETGKKTSGKDYLGKPALLFFGFTNCPDICPTTLARLTSIIDSLETDKRHEMQVLFVSVDHKRDTAENLGAYTDAFSKQVIGLTGDKAELDILTRRYRVAYALGEPDDEGNYEVSHSSAVFAFDREGRAKLLIRDSDPQDFVADDLSRLLSQS